MVITGRQRSYVRRPDMMRRIVIVNNIIPNTTTVYYSITHEYWKPVQKVMKWLYCCLFIWSKRNNIIHSNLWYVSIINSSNKEKAIFASYMCVYVCIRSNHNSFFPGAFCIHTYSSTILLGTGKQLNKDRKIIKIHIYGLSIVDPWFSTRHYFIIRVFARTYLQPAAGSVKKYHR